MCLYACVCVCARVCVETVERRWLRVAVMRTGGNFADIDVTLDIVMASTSSSNGNCCFAISHCCFDTLLVHEPNCS